MSSWLRRLFKRRDPLDQPCRCGRQATVLVSPEKEALESGQTPYCLWCLERALDAALGEATGRWVIVQPLRDAPCYVPFALAELEYFEDAPGWLRRVTALLDAAGAACSRCGKPAGRFAWVPTEADLDFTELYMGSTWIEGCPVTVLCDRCLAASLLDSLRDREVKVYELVFPKDGPGVWLPWGY